MSNNFLWNPDVKETGKKQGRKSGETGVRKETGTKQED